jgi:hypothetical protein
MPRKVNKVNRTRKNYKNRSKKINKSRSRSKNKNRKKNNSKKQYGSGLFGPGRVRTQRGRVSKTGMESAKAHQRFERELEKLQGLLNNCNALYQQRDESLAKFCSDSKRQHCKRFSIGEISSGVLKERSSGLPSYTSPAQSYYPSQPTYDTYNPYDNTYPTDTYPTDYY